MAKNQTAPMTIPANMSKERISLLADHLNDIKNAIDKDSIKFLNNIVEEKERAKRQEKANQLLQQYLAVPRPILKAREGLTKIYDKYINKGNFFPKILGFFKNIYQSISQKAGSWLKTILMALLFFAIFDPKGKFLTSILRFVGNIAIWIIKLVIKFLPGVIKTMWDLFWNVVVPEFGRFGKQIGYLLYDALSELLSKFWISVKTLGKDIFEYFKSLPTKLEKLFKELPNKIFGFLSPSKEKNKTGTKGKDKNSNSFRESFAGFFESVGSLFPIIFLGVGLFTKFGGVIKLALKGVLFLTKGIFKLTLFLGKGLVSSLKFIGPSLFKFFKFIGIGLIKSFKFIGSSMVSIFKFIGPKLFTFLKFIGGGLLKTFKLLGTGLKFLFGALRAFLVFLIANPIVAILLALVVGVALLFKYTKQIKTFLKNLPTWLEKNWGFIGKFLAKIVRGFNAVFLPILDFIQLIKDEGIVKAFKIVWKKTKEFMWEAWQSIKEKFWLAMDFLGAVFSNPIKWFTTMTDQEKNAQVAARTLVRHNEETVELGMPTLKGAINEEAQKVMTGQKSIDDLADKIENLNDTNKKLLVKQSKEDYEKIIKYRRSKEFESLKD